MKFFAADYILPISSKPIAAGVIQLDKEGKIIKLGKREDFPSVDIQKLSGIILPGFVNAHCHLELSHMQDICETGTGLIPFITKVVSLRDFEQEVILDGIRRRDQEMYDNGIQAVGDICNKTDTAACKDKSPIHYYSFVELFDLMQPSMTAATIENYSAVFEKQSTTGLNKKSYVPHAPYSVSPKLFDFINKANSPDDVTSFHNQETTDENELFLNGGGGFPAFYQSLGLSLNHFKPEGIASIDYAIQNMTAGRQCLFVHNTLTSKVDIKKAHDWSEHAYWVTCPNANMYIEKRLPDYSRFIELKAKVCLGTDSIMSNWQLSIWEEIKTIKKYQSYVPLSLLLEWATLNGAKALKYDDTLGSLEPGKKPGLVHVDLSWAGEQTKLEASKARRLI